MNKKKLKELLNKSVDKVVEYSPEILKAISIIGFVTSGITAVKATPRALTILDEELKTKRGINAKPPAIIDIPKYFSNFEIIKLTWRCYVSSAILSAMSITCMITSASISKKRQAALSTAYMISEKAFREYKDKVISTIGKNKEGKIVDEIMQDKLENSSIDSKEVIITGNGDYLFYDEMNDRYFESNTDFIKKKVNEYNRMLIIESFLSLNEWYYMIGLKPTKLGDDLGWNVGNGLLELRLTASLTSDDRPCIVIGYDNPPVYGFSKL